MTDRTEIILTRDLLAEIKQRLRISQVRSAVSANAEMINLYWDVGKLIAARKQDQGWGSGVLARLATELKNELPEQKGFSVTNLQRMVQFQKEYPNLSEISARAVLKLENTENEGVTGSSSNQARAVPILADDQDVFDERVLLLSLSWGHNIVLMQKLSKGPSSSILMISLDRFSRLS